ncbi:MAG: prolyl-tRNA synthetase [Olpidium bornovanus]|uniref:Prolyl-tRNA synthetase n=1 Tax=Olpidium bornovanus TaxID=278681 RepID=A0A8H7ZWQ8_9FUNG|nr:MAG: prolyl-tRNA synthetase [Olpidium bornovanus]
MDLATSQTLSVRRDTGAKAPIPMATLAEGVSALLSQIQRDLFEKARVQRDAGVKRVRRWEEFVPQLDRRGFCLIPWCEQERCEDQIKEKSTRVTTGDEPVDDRAPSMGAKSLCIPFDQPKDEPIVPGKTKCVSCGADAVCWALFGRSY